MCPASPAIERGRQVKDYRVHHAVRDDMNEGWIYVKDEDLVDNIRGRRPIAKVTHGNKHVYCGIMYADHIDIARFNDYLANANLLDEEVENDFIFINTWYWKLLGMPELPQNLRVTITPSHTLYAYCVSCFQHPQVVVVLGTVLAFIGTGLGVVGVGLGFVGIGLAIAEWRTLWLTLGVATNLIGALFCAVGVWPLVNRARRGV